ncbi:MAG: 50S ribosomal protein L18 [Candidatus Taylorbacteria bacterium]|nr:50S ribosomal protein L18 [Candidatus Taylorbacteria bacterium]
MNTSKQKQMKIERRHRKIRSILSGTAERPRLSVFKSNKFLYAQLIDDEKGHTLAQANSNDAKTVGVDIAKKAKTLKIEKVVFDRGGYLYTGKIKAIADSAREGGLNF